MSKVQTTQSTGKLWKFFQLVGTLAILAGVVGLIVGAQSDGSQVLAALGLTGVVLGFPFYVAGRVGGWWFHG